MDVPATHPATKMSIATKIPLRLLPGPIGHHCGDYKSRRRDGAGGPLVMQIFTRIQPAVIINFYTSYYRLSLS